MRTKEAAVRNVINALVTFPRTPINTIAEFINAHEIEGQCASDSHGLNWAAQSRLYDAFVKAAIIRGAYGLSLKKAQPGPVPIAKNRPKKQLSQKRQKAARLLVVEMVKLARTPINIVAEFIIANGVSGISFGEANGISQAAENRLHDAFKKVSHIEREAQRVESIRTIFFERGTAVRNSCVRQLLLKDGRSANADLINQVRRELRHSIPGRTGNRLRVIGG